MGPGTPHLAWFHSVLQSSPQHRSRSHRRAALRCTHRSLCSCILRGMGKECCNGTCLHCSKSPRDRNVLVGAVCAGSHSSTYTHTHTHKYTHMHTPSHCCQPRPPPSLQDVSSTHEGKLPQTPQHFPPLGTSRDAFSPRVPANIQPLKTFLESQDLPSMGQGKLPFPLASHGTGPC